MVTKLNGVAALVVLSVIMLAPPPAAAFTSPIAKDGCQNKCGNVSIWYPFGIGSAECFYNKWFEILCSNDKPYLRLNPNGVEATEVLATSSFDDESGLSYDFVVRSDTSNMRVCEDTSKPLGANLTGSPFIYSRSNKFMLVGTGFAVYFDSRFRGGCTSVRDGQSPRRAIDKCYGVNCCQATIQGFDTYQNWFYFQAYHLDFSNSLLGLGGNSCASAFLVNSSWYPKNASLFSDPSASLVDVSVPVLLGLRIPKSMPGHGFQNNTYCETYVGDLWMCRCPCGFFGNPYIVGGCRDQYFDCSRSFLLKHLKSVVGGGICLLVFVMAIAIYGLYKTIRRRIYRKLKGRTFKRNGGLLLEKYLSSNVNIMEKVRLFTAKDLNKATDQFNDNRILGRGGQGTVYKGMLTNGKIVAIKKSKLLANANQVEEFINEIIILSQIDHRNVVKLFGCCLEMDVPLLVYEYIPNGTLYNLIHSDNTDFPLTWEVRLRISLEIAEALTYLHSATSIPVYHRDIKSSNILLDERYKAKVADFGTSRHIGVDQTHLTTLVKGTFGYLDPEYFQSSQFTEKSDVYSFGVVLIELLTGLKPICFFEEEQSHLNLATRFLLAIEENCVHIILDPQVKITSREEELEAIIRLSQRCLNINGRNRPSMKEIVIELQRIKESRTPSEVLENFYENGAGNEKEVGFSGIVTSLNITTSSSHGSPFLSGSF